MHSTMSADLHPRGEHSARAAVRDRPAAADAVLGALRTLVAAFDEDGRQLRYANAPFADAFMAGGAPTPTADSFGARFTGRPSLRALVRGGDVDGGDPDEWRHEATGTWYAVRSHLADTAGARLLICEMNDISLRMQQALARRSEHQQLLFTSKMMSVGEMAATLAHELNQPIGSLLNYLNGCLLRLDRQSPAGDLREALLEARQQSERAAAIITRIREFVRTREPRMSSIDVPAALGKVAVLLDAEIKLAGVELTIEVAPRLPATLADSVMIEQVVHNLTKNAIEAMRGQSSPRRLRLGARVDPTGQIEVSVRDSGPGVPESARDQLFSHFFTSKPDGLGIGLNICRSIIEFHGGALFYDHPPDGGCRFCFTLPVQAA